MPHTGDEKRGNTPTPRPAAQAHTGAVLARVLPDPMDGVLRDQSPHISEQFCAAKKISLQNKNLCSKLYHYLLSPLREQNRNKSTLINN